jgi:hypothetical protein
VRRGWLGMLAGVCEMGRRVVTAVVFVVSFRGSDCCVVLLECGGRRESRRQREREIADAPGVADECRDFRVHAGAPSDRQDTRYYCS